MGILYKVALFHIKSLINIIVKKYSIVKVMGWPSASNSSGDAGNNNQPNPSPKQNPDTIISKDSEENRKKKTKASSLNQVSLEKESLKLKKAVSDYRKIEDKHHNEIKAVKDFYQKYKNRLPRKAKEDGKKIIDESNDASRKIRLINVTESWKDTKGVVNDYRKVFNDLLRIMEDNSEFVQNNIGGKKSEKGSQFRKELDNAKVGYSKCYKETNSFINKQLSNSHITDRIFKENNVSKSQLAKWLA
jgi:hypothetical protein